METPDPTPGADLLPPPSEDDEERRADPDSPESDPAEPAAPDEVPPEVAPAVVAILVTSDPGPWLEDALESLAAQEYPALSVLVLDNGSSDDLTPRIAAAMPRAFVRRLDTNIGFAAAANDAMALVEGATFLLFCHDDVVLGPDAVSVMVEEAYRSNAGIVGPKLVDYDHPEVLLEVGMAVDHYGVPFTGIEPGEIDQEQHDAVRDVFFVSDAAMLVRTDLFHELGGFDPATFPGSDDLDLCWRARLAGARVLVAPDARVRHRRSTVQDTRPTSRNDQGDLKAFTRSRVRVLTKSYSPVALLWVLPLAFLLNVAEAIALVFTRRPARARALLAGWFSAFRRGTGIRQARASTQRMRRIDDGDVRDLMVRGSARVRTIVSYRLHAGDRLAEVSNRTRAAVSDVSTRARTFHVVAAIGLAVLIAFGSRSLVLDRVPQVGSFQDWPGAGSLWSTFFAPWRYAMMGADSAASPVFGLMALLTTALFGDSDLGRTLVVAGALPLGAFGAYRLVRPLAGMAAPAVAASVAYAINPIVRNAIAEGQLGPLVCFGLAPFAMSALLRASAAGADRRARWHAAATIALLLLVAAAAWPPALFLALFLVAGFALAWPLVGGADTVARSAVAAALATLGAAILLAPWLLTMFGADPATFGLYPRAPLSLADIVAFHTGASGAGFGAVGLLVAAALPLVVATGERLAWAGRAWMLALLSFGCAWLPTRFDVHASVPAPEGVLVPAALGLALAAGLGVAAFLEDLRTFHFGWRQFAAVAAAVGIALPVIGFAADTLDGRWGMSNDDWPTRFAWMNEERDNGDFKVLWVGDPTIMPTDAKVVDGVGFGLTRQGPGDARALWAPPEGDAERVLGNAIALVQDQDTIRLGHLLGPTGVRYVAFVTRAAPDSGAHGRPDPALTESLAAQLDLAVSRIEPGAVVYENQAWLPGRAMVPRGTDVPVDSPDPLAAAQRTSVPDAKAVKGPLSGSDPAGPGMLLWAESANSGWRASVGGKRAPRSDAFGWTNGFEVSSRGPVDLSFAGGPRRLFVLVELLLWVAAGALWWRSRATARIAVTPTDASDGA
jgi:GT2 family glycosyltransferase